MSEGRRRKVPKELRRLRAALTEERRLELFRETFGRDPGSDEELNAFIRELTVEMYNNGDDEW